VRVSGEGFQPTPSLVCGFGVASAPARWLSPFLVECNAPKVNETALLGAAQTAAVTLRVALVEQPSEFTPQLVNFTYARGCFKRESNRQGCGLLAR
jgi:hypothetical protein